MFVEGYGMQWIKNINHAIGQSKHNKEISNNQHKDLTQKIQTAKI